MKKRLYMLLLLAAVLLVAGCSSTPDQVSDPLAGFDVDATIPFATKAPSAVTAAPTVAPTATPAFVFTQPTQNWQSEQGTIVSTVTPTPRPTPVPTPTPGPREEILSVGSKGNNVKLLQERLIALGYLGGKADGAYGSQTSAAVRLFQETMGLTATGTADLLTLKYVYANVKTYSEMISASTPTYAPTPVPSTIDGYVLLQRGSEGPEVTRLQTRLIQLGYLTDSADGDFGSITETAVKLFQAQLGWEQTGVATSSLQSYLYSGSAPSYGGSTPAAAATKAPQPTTVVSSYVQLSPGDTGEPVKRLQTRLKELGYFDGEIGGNYLTKTTNAVKLFQQALGLEQTGVATVGLQEKLFSTTAPYSGSASSSASSSQENGVPVSGGETSTGYALLQYGDTGDSVTRLQTRLKALGYLTANATGNYLTQTEAAIRLVQAQAGVEQTGVATAALQKYIFSDQIPAYGGSVAPANTSVTPAPQAQPQQKETTSSTSAKALQIILQPGDTGSKVKKLQTALQELGYFDGEIGGNFLSKTTESVKTAQRMCGYADDGVATYALMERLLDTSAPTWSEAQNYHKLSLGDIDDAVYAMQLRLIELGFYPDYESKYAGKFSLSTQAAVEDAQRMRGLECIDDFASAEFQAYLFSDAAYFHSYVEFGG